MRNLGSILLGVLLLTACATSPTGQRQLQLFPESQMQQLGATAYQELRENTPVARDPAINRYVQCVARNVTARVGGDTPWEVTVFRDDQANAFALPGGKIGIYTGLLDVARGQDQLAAVVAHEVAHVLADHHNARISAQYATQAGLSLVDAVVGGGAGSSQIMGLLGLGARYGVLMPYSRAQESESDTIGLELMARAGFDPRASVDLWRNMAAAGGPSPPAFLSTHPSGGQRIDNLQRRMPEAMALYREARSAGRRPDCRS